MTRKRPEKHPFRIHAAVRRDSLTGEAVKWFDRATWLQGRVLQIAASERTAYQQDLDELWEAVDLMEKGEGVSVDTGRLQRLFGSFFVRWPSELGEESPRELR